MVAVATGDYMFLNQYIEGNRMADLLWGTANAKQVILRFWSRTPQRLNKPFVVAIRNSPVTHSIVFNLNSNPSSNIWTEHIVVIPGPTVGTWATDNTPGMSISITVASGATYNTATIGAWLAGNWIGTSAIVNYAGANDPLHIGDVGLHADPAKTGKAPPWQYQSERLATLESERYWQKCQGNLGVALNTTGTHGRGSYANHGQMRIVPAISLVGTMQCWDQATQPQITAIGAAFSNQSYFEMNFTSNAAQTLGRASMITSSSQTVYIAHNARM